MRDAVKRAQLTPEILKVKQWADTCFEKAFEALHKKAYVSLVIERRWSRSFTQDPKSKGLKEEISFGWNLRGFDGLTMFERAGDEFNSLSIDVAVKELDNEIKAVAARYIPPSWEERLKSNLESEIKTQIPKVVDPQTWVHFGTAMNVPLPEDNTQIMNQLESEFSSIQKTLESSVVRPDFIQLSYRLSIEEFLFVDESVKMSQSLVRPMRALMGVKGAHMVREARGSLGGYEVLDPSANIGLSELLSKLEKLENAERIKPGKYKVLLSPSLAGVFAHEAFGHSQEADTWMRNRSKAKELYESQHRVGNEFATILNNPAIFKNGPEETGAWGSYFFDEEGWLAKSQVLVDKGYLKPPMTDLTSAFRLKLPRSANGKRQDWTHGMYSRQTNTYFAGGQQTFAQLLEKIDHGFLASVCYGGMEDPKGMGIQVGIQYLEEVKNGQLTGKTFVAPNGGAVQMTGQVEEYLNSILGVSKIEAFSNDPDQSIHPWNEVGGCGKYHKEFVKAGCGGTYLLLNQVSLG